MAKRARDPAWAPLEYYAARIEQAETTATVRLTTQIRKKSSRATAKPPQPSAAAAERHK